MTLLSVEFRRRIDRLHLHSRSVFRGKFKGERRSTNKGTGVEFADYRVYELGNDLHHVDWNVYARLDRLFIKLFRAEEDLPVSILLDNSKSMDFGEPTKFSQAKQLAAALGYMGLAGLDRVAIHVFSNRARPIVPPTYGKAQFLRMSRALEAVNVGGQTDMATCLKYLITHSRQAGAAVIISDFLDINSYTSSLKQLLARKFDLTLIQILADAEINPGYRSASRIRSGRALPGRGCSSSHRLRLVDEILRHGRIRLPSRCPVPPSLRGTCCRHPYCSGWSVSC